MKSQYIKISILAYACISCCACSSHYRYYEGYSKDALGYILLNSRLGGGEIVLPKTAIYEYIPHLKLDSFYVTIPNIKVVGFTMTVQMTDFNKKAWYRKWKWYEYDQYNKIYVSYSNKLTAEMHEAIWQAGSHICGVTFGNFKLEGGEEFYHKHLLQTKPIKILLVNDATHTDGQYSDE